MEGVGARLAGGSCYWLGRLCVVSLKMHSLTTGQFLSDGQQSC